MWCGACVATIRLLKLGLEMKFFYENHFIHGLMMTYYKVNSIHNFETVRSTMYEF